LAPGSADLSSPGPGFRYDPYHLLLSGIGHWALEVLGEIDMRQQFDSGFAQVRSVRFGKTRIKHATDFSQRTRRNALSLFLFCLSALWPVLASAAHASTECPARSGTVTRGGAVTINVSDCLQNNNIAFAGEDAVDGRRFLCMVRRICGLISPHQQGGYWTTATTATALPATFLNSPTARSRAEQFE